MKTFPIVDRNSSSFSLSEFELLHLNHFQYNTCDQADRKTCQHAQSTFEDEGKFLRLPYIFQEA
jgi:hypothetical protein